ncbi:hypothetical protein [Novosphingobium sp. UBA1939]|uniref:hypothetical protein n=1 Tax=Novosphingobium sp. UBA1939 TaxID=1946982 RepID=UPI0025E14CFC|nr:hypothetical protein [Novosphingobium sp. UBA1939]
MNVNSADSSSALASGVYEEYRRYERYLALACGLGLVVVVSLLCPGAAWGGSGALLLAIVGSFHRYHRAVHRYVGRPSPDTDHALQLWGTTAQACVWGAVPIVLALVVLQVYA